MLLLLLLSPSSLSSLSSKDGVSQKLGFKYGESSNPRRYLLYNYYTNIDIKSSFDINSSAPVAIRDQQYKLIHTYADSLITDWYESESRNDDDFAIYEANSCNQGEAVSYGTYAKFFFDLKNDPYETTNLYDEDEYQDKISEFYRLLEAYKGSATEDTQSATTIKAAYVEWKANGNYVTPWVKDDVLRNDNGSSYPSFCTFNDSVVSPVYNDNVDDDFDYDDNFDDDGGSNDDNFGDDNTPFPTAKPTPTKSPTFKRTKGPTAFPSEKPTSTNPTSKPDKSLSLIHI